MAPVLKDCVIKHFQHMTLLQSNYNARQNYFMEQYTPYILLPGVISVLFLPDEGDHSIIEMLQ